MYKLTISPYWNTELTSSGSNKGKHKLYYKISYNRKNTKIKSSLYSYLSEDEFDKLKDSKEVNWEVSLITRIMEIDTDGLKLTISDFKGFSEKIKIYFTKVEEVYKVYGLKLIEQPLLQAQDKMNNKELLIYNELNKLLPVEEYLAKEGSYYSVVNRNPHSYCLLVFGFLDQFDITGKDKVLYMIKKDIIYYMEGLNELQSFYESKYLTAKTDALIIHWMEYNMKDQFAQYLNQTSPKGLQMNEQSIFSFTPHFQINTLSKTAEETLTRVDIGLSHSIPFLKNIGIPSMERNIKSRLQQ